MYINNFYTPKYTKDYKLLEQNYHTRRQAELEKTFQAPEYWQILNRAEGAKKNSGCTLSLKSENSQKDIHVKLKIEKKFPQGLNPSTTYEIYDGLTKAGYVTLEEFPDGAYIAKVENMKQELYGGVDKLAMKLAVANCEKRGLKNFNITGDAINNSHAIHYLSGMRFGEINNKYIAERAKALYGTNDVNKIVKSIIAETPKNGRYYTAHLGCVNMHLMKTAIKNIMEYLKKHPVLV